MVPTRGKPVYGRGGGLVDILIGVEEPSSIKELFSQRPIAISKFFSFVFF